MMFRLPAAALLIAVSGCSAYSTPAAPSTPVPARFSDLTPLLGAYALTVSLDANCSSFPVAARSRSYRATLTQGGTHYLAVEIEGGGYSERTVIGDLFSAEFSVSHALHLKWNSFDVACEYTEPLASGGSILFCGSGPATSGTAGLEAAIDGFATLYGTGDTAIATCQGTHRLTFERTQ
jgi:hypothetical protein